jgi:hypothetical protein
VAIAQFNQPNKKKERMKSISACLSISAAMLFTAACSHQSLTAEAPAFTAREIATVKPSNAPHGVYAALSCTEAGKDFGERTRTSILLRPRSGVFKISGKSISLKRNGDKREKRKANGKVDPKQPKRFTASGYAIVAPNDIFRADGPVEISSVIENKSTSLSCVTMDHYVERAAKTTVK